MGKVKFTFPLLLLFLVLASGYAWLDGWKFRKYALVKPDTENRTGVIYLNTRRLIEQGKMNPDCSDIRTTLEGIYTTELFGNNPHPPYYDMCCDSSFCYLLAENYVIKLYKNNKTFVGNVSIPLDRPYHCVILSDKLYSIDWDEELLVLNLTNFSSYSVINTTEKYGIKSPLALKTDGTYLFLAGNPEGPLGPSAAKILKIEADNLNSVVTVTLSNGTYSLTTPFAITLSNDSLFVSGYTPAPNDTLVIFKLSKENLMIEKTYVNETFKYYPIIRSATFLDKYVFLAGDMRSEASASIRYGIILKLDENLTLLNMRKLDSSEIDESDIVSLSTIAPLDYNRLVLSTGTLSAHTVLFIIDDFLNLVNKKLVTTSGTTNYDSIYIENLGENKLIYVPIYSSNYGWLFEVKIYNEFLNFTILNSTCNTNYTLIFVKLPYQSEQKVLIYYGNKTATDASKSFEEFSISTPEKYFFPTAWTSIGGFHTCFIWTNRTLYCWGDNSHGQIGNGTIGGTVKVPTPILRNVRNFCIGKYHTCAVLTNSSLYCWGDNDGQLGTGDAISRASPTHILDNVLMVSCGLYHTCAILNNGTLYCWGENTYGQVGDGTSGNIKYSPTEVLLPENETPILVSAGGWHTCAITINNETGSRSLYCWGRNDKGQLGVGDTNNRATPEKVQFPTEDFQVGEQKVLSVALGLQHTCSVNAFKADNCPNGYEPGSVFKCLYHVVYCWGDNSHGQAIGSSEYYLTPNKLIYTNPRYYSTFPFITAGYYHTCISRFRHYYMSSTDIRVSYGVMQCWGDNSHGQIGNGELGGIANYGADYEYYPKISVEYDNYPYNFGIYAIYAGAYHTCALKNSDGKLYCWGDNDYYQVSSEDNSTDYPEPVEVADIGGYFNSFDGIFIEDNYIDNATYFLVPKTTYYISIGDEEKYGLTIFLSSPNPYSIIYNDHVITKTIVEWHANEPTEVNLSITLNNTEKYFAKLEMLPESSITITSDILSDYEGTHILTANGTASNGDSDSSSVEITFVFYDISISDNSGGYFNTKTIPIKAKCYRTTKEQVRLELGETPSTTIAIATLTCPFDKELSYDYSSTNEGNITITAFLKPLNTLQNHSASIWYISDLTPPYYKFENSLKFGFLNQTRANFSVQLFDNLSPNITCEKIVLFDYLTNGTYSNASIVLHNQSIYSSKIAFCAYCEDLAGNENRTCTYLQFYRRCFHLVNEKTGEIYNPSPDKVNITITAIENQLSEPFNTSWICINSNKTDNIKIDFDYGNNLMITRYFGLDVLESDNTRVCAEDATTFYEHHAISSEVIPVYIYNPTTDCYILADKTRFSEQEYYTTRAYAVDAVYYIYILRDGQKIYLASLDGSQPSTINLDVLEYRASGGFTLPSAEPIIVTSKVFNTTLYIYYKNQNADNKKLVVRIRNLNGDKIYFEHTEEDNPNEVALYFDYSTLNITGNPILKVEFTEYKTDGNEQHHYRYFNLEGKSGKFHPYFAIFLSIATLIFGITLVANNIAFGWLGILLSMVSLGLLAFSITDWKVTFIEAAVAVASLYIFLASLSRQAKTLI